GKIIAVEAGTEDLECLYRNFSGEVATGRVLVIPKERGTTLDKIVAEMNLPRLHYIKIDNEGAECTALAGARDTISRFKPRIAVTTYHRASDPKRIEQTIRAIRSDYQVQCGPCAPI